METNLYIMLKDGEEPLKTSTETLLSPSALGTLASVALMKGSLITHEESQEFLSLQHTKEMLEESFKAVKSGDLSILEETLLNQTFALNLAFTNLVARANRQVDMPLISAMMNLAFKAQNQSRMTIDSLVNIKNPSQTSFIKQTNIAHGHQQVNNSLESNQDLHNKLLGGEDNVRLRMDTRKKRVSKASSAKK